MYALKYAKSSHLLLLECKMYRIPLGGVVTGQTKAHRVYKAQKLFIFNNVYVLKATVII